MIYDLAIIGGGINGCGIARDAAGRGLKVLLVEQGDLASATSSWSSKLIHGGLRYLEQYQFRLVRESLQEREVLLKIAPHLIHPLEFILPYDQSMRPAWMLRAGLFMYDHIGGRISLPGSRGVKFPDARYSAGLSNSISRGFFYSDAKVDDARLTILNAVGARERGAAVRTRTRLTAGAREGGAWVLTLTDTRTGASTRVTARGVVNAAGPWVSQVLSGALGVATSAKTKLVKGSHIVVPRIHTEAHAYILQNLDKRVCFVIPFEDKFSLIGTTDVPVDSPEAGTTISETEIQYLLAAANRFLAKPLTAKDVLWSYAGVRPLYDSGEAKASEVTRDYVLKVDAVDKALPVLSIFGGKITTYRRLAEHALAELAPFYPEMGATWTDGKPLPGGDMPAFAEQVSAVVAQYPFLSAEIAAKLVGRHGSRVAALLDGATTAADMGEFFGTGAHQLSEREIKFFMREEWAETADDILWRRTKCGLHMDANEQKRATQFIANLPKA